MASGVEQLDEGLQAIDPSQFAITAGRLISNLASNPLSAGEFLGGLDRFANVEVALGHLEHMADLAFGPEAAENVKLGINVAFLSLLRHVEVERTREQVEGPRPPSS